MSDGARSGSLIGIVAYLLLAFGLAWGSWWILLPKTATGEIGHYQLYLLPGAFAPALATFIVRKWITREGFGDAGLGLHLSQWRYYLIAWLLPLFVLAFIVLGAMVLRIAHPDFSMAKGLARLAPHARLPAAVSGIIGFLMPLQLLVTAPLAAPLLFGEEFGWRGYLQLRLFARWPTLAAVSTGVIWGLWHLPIILRGGEYPGITPVIATSVFCAGTVMVSIVFGWLRRRSGSVWVTSLAHSATNAIGGSLTVLWFPDPSSWLLVGYLGVLSWIPFGLISVLIILFEPRVRAGDREGVPL